VPAGEVVRAAKSVQQVEGTVMRAGVVDDEGVFQLPQRCAQVNHDTSRIWVFLVSDPSAKN
jgi:hypothetical protein